MPSFARGDRSLHLSYPHLSDLASSVFVLSSMLSAALRCMVAVLLLAAASFAFAKGSGHDLAKTTLTTTVDSTSCIVFTPGGSSREVPCSDGGWSVDLLPGEVAQFVVGFTYTYADDGLSLSSGDVEIRCNGLPCAFDPGNAAFEFGQLTVGVSCGPGCSASYPQFLPLTDGPDSFSLGSSLFQATPFFSTAAQSVTFDFFADAVTVSVTPVPEPGTWLLMALALPLMAGLALRQRSMG